MCGKNQKDTLFLIEDVGLPPRVRDKQIPSAIRRPLVRITPACAGKTLLKNSFLICGSGSHPRVREKLKRRHHLRRLSRITPACAGKTILDKAYLHLNWDHPRVCGKNHCNSAIHTIYLCAFYVNKADTIADFRKFSQRCFLRSTFFTMIRFPME